MVFIETTAFTARIRHLISDETYRELQGYLAEAPDAGPVIQGTGGLRKIRWSVAGRGKRGGVRVIYYWHPLKATVLMLFIFAKNERDDLSSAQRAALRRIVEAEYR